jgi:hypothetical protein
VKQHEQSYIAAESRNEFAVYAGKSTVIGFALLGAALTALSVIAALLGPTELSGIRGSPFGRVMVYLSVVVCFLMTLYTLFLVFSSAPRLVVSSEGIWINSPFVFGTGIVPWANMTSI